MGPHGWRTRSSGAAGTPCMLWTSGLKEANPSRGSVGLEEVTLRTKGLLPVCRTCHVMMMPSQFIFSAHTFSSHINAFLTTIKVLSTLGCYSSVCKRLSAGNTIENQFTNPTGPRLCVCVCVCVRERERERERKHRCASSVNGRESNALCEWSGAHV